MIILAVVIHDAEKPWSNDQNLWMTLGGAA
jgi:hypothetical protein